jgi:predicted nucleotidyltransferase
VELRLLLVDRLRAELASWDVQPAAAALFGSAARGDGGTDSDIDLFVVRSAAIEVDDPVWAAQTDALATRVRAWTGNNASIVESSVEELADLIDRAPPVLDSIGADAVDLSARPIRSLLKRRTAAGRS